MDDNAVLMPLSERSPEHQFGCSISEMATIPQPSRSGATCYVVSGSWRDELAHLAVCSDREPSAHLPPLRPADLPAGGAQAVPALMPGPNKDARAPSCRRQIVRPLPSLSRPASRSVGCQAASNPLKSYV